MDPTAPERASRLKLMIFDVDGVLTDGRLYLSGAGEEMKAFNARDGQGIKLLRESGVAVGIITARRSLVVERRAKELGIDLLRQGALDKAGAFADVLSSLDLDAARAGYMGDDLADLPVLTRCGFAATVSSAPEIVIRHAHYIARAAGGGGAAREVCEFVMTSQGTLESAIAAFLA